MNISTNTLSKMAEWAKQHAAFFQRAIDDHGGSHIMISTWEERRDAALAAAAQWDQGIVAVPFSTELPENFDSLVEYFDVALGELAMEALDHWDGEMPLEGLLGVWVEVMDILGSAVSAGVWNEFQAYVVADTAKRREEGEEDDPQFLDEMLLLVQDPEAFFLQALALKE